MLRRQTSPDSPYTALRYKLVFVQRKSLPLSKHPFLIIYAGNGLLILSNFYCQNTITNFKGNTNKVGIINRRQLPLQFLHSSRKGHQTLDMPWSDIFIDTFFDYITGVVANQYRNNASARDEPNTPPDTADKIEEFMNTAPRGVGTALSFSTSPRVRCFKLTVKSV